MVKEFEKDSEVWKKSFPNGNAKDFEIHGTSKPKKIIKEAKQQIQKKSNDSDVDKVYMHLKMIISKLERKLVEQERSIEQLQASIRQIQDRVNEIKR